MRRPLTDRGRAPAGSFLRGKQLSHVLILVIAFTAAAYGVVREAAPSTALEPSTEQLAVVGWTEPLDGQTALDITPQTTIARASGGGTTARSEGTATSKQQASAETATAEGTPSVEVAHAGPSAADGTPTATMTAEERIRSLMVTPVATPSLGTPRASGTFVATPTPTAIPKPTCEPSESAAYCIYTVAEGDTLSSLAARFGLENKDLLGWELLAASNKPDITDINVLLQPGQKLRIPMKSGLVHTVIFAETVGDLADIFDVTSASIVEANGLANADLLQPGQVLLIPNPKRLEAPPPPAPEPTPEPATPTQPPSAPEPPPQSRPSRPVSSAGFIWPITAGVNITSYFGPRHPLGIDLGLAHAARSSIVAVADGKVIFAGGNPCCSYGLYVIVQHDSGLQTLYGHLSRLDVRTGQTVAQGDSLGPSGSTGYSTGFHLHFEVSKNGVRLNPVNYLPVAP